MTIFREFDNAIVNQLKKLDVKDGDSKLNPICNLKKECYRCDDFRKNWCVYEEKTINDGEKPTRTVKNADVYRPESKTVKETPKEPPLKSELDDMANITQIIEIYDNGHENVFYPNTHIIVEKADLEKKKIIPLMANIISNETTEEYCSSEIIAELLYEKLGLGKYLDGAENNK